MSSIIAFAGNVPANYDKHLGPVLFEPYALDMVERLKNDTLRNVLEIACGTGRVTRHLARLLAPGGRLTATDLNQDMLNIAAQKVPGERVAFEVADALNLPFNDNSFDHAVCQYGVMFFPDKLLAFRETRRVLHPGGKFLFNTWDKLANNPVNDVMNNVMQEVLGSEAPDFLEKGPFSFHDPEVIDSLMTEAGFRDITIERVQLSSSYATASSMMQGIVDGSPLSSYLIERDPAVQEKVRNRIQEELIARFGETNALLKLQAFVCQGFK
ncbi:MAG TPA: methyltransferase domain-containing protein [Flavisolibacter sp.]